MTTGAQRGILVGAARRVVAAARAERAVMPQDDVEREFYLGVEAAAEGVIHPELEMTRSPSWVERQTPEFREGYVRMTTMLATARCAAAPPFQLRLPDPKD